MYKDAAELLKDQPEGTFPELELEWLAVAAWNRACHHGRFGRSAAARSFMQAAQQLVRHRAAKEGRLEVMNLLSPILTGKCMYANL